jgi:outer membrane protein assembly factor BamA
VPLKSARVLPLPPWRHKVQGTKIQFVGESPVSEEAVRELMQVRAGGEVDEVTLDHDIRAVYRTGHFESVEFKLEIVDANTRNLLVILKPKARDKSASSK